MRTATIRLSFGGDSGAGQTELHPADSEVAAHPDIERETIDHVTELADDTGVLLCRLRGSHSVLKDILASTDGVLDYHVTVAGQTVYSHVHFEPTETTKALLGLQRSHELIVRMPIRWVADGRLEVSAVGDDRTFQQAIEALPDSVDVELVEIGAYDPTPNRPESVLTDRQLDVLDAAIAVGYYEEPRNGTQADVAEAVGLAPATAGEHLRRIEGNVLTALRK